MIKVTIQIACTKNVPKRAATNFANIPVRFEENGLQINMETFSNKKRRWHKISSNVPWISLVTNFEWKDVIMFILQRNWQK